MPGLDASSTRHDGVTVVALNGELDLATADTLVAQIAKAYKQAPGLVLDLTELVFIDSAGLGVLLQAQRKATEHGGAVALASCRPQVARALQLSGLDSRIPCYATAAQALTDHSFTARSPTDKSSRGGNGRVIE
ncbi:STAS domain-containing protein [Actinomadura sp. HBU206391]|uniref:STAS domain-containing protein n=1 Tax=Actinomadura sp. HBU206391 TaxID=2731692 RepID=UPI00164FF9F4|nr:STAS domain-containing protein [Actinomadura sp. HBU206391]MBC6463564.1 STAS domain-containing protein [Actinomadura sp. HBU206391]